MTAWKHKILVVEDEIIVAFDDKQYYATDGLYLFGLKENADIYYIMGILNSRLLVFIYRLLALEEGRMLAQVKPTLLNILPIPIVALEDYKKKQQHDDIIHFVGNILKLKEQLNNTKLDNNRQQLQRAIDHAERRIDELVYELYGLTEEEVAIVEGKS